MIRSLMLLFLAACMHLHAGSSANYSLTPSTIDTGGLRGTSANLTADFSNAPGSAGSSANLLSRSGHAGQLFDATALDLAASPSTVNEGSTRQLIATLLFDDATTSPLAAESIAWSVQSGPLSGISSSGLATASIVYQDGAAVVYAAYQSLTDTLALTVLNTHLDNFAPYAGDRVDDAWQVQYYGLISPGNAGPNDDSDSDGLTNLLEFAFGTLPTSNSSGTPALQYNGTFSGGGSIGSTGQPVVAFEPVTTGLDFRAVFIRRKNHLADGLLYTPQFSANLTFWQSSAVVPVVLADDGVYQVVSVPYPPLVGGRKARFFRVSISLSP